MNGRKKMGDRMGVRPCKKKKKIKVFSFVCE